ncbi:MAG TPA: MFS transporter [Candidatus Cybelea sp.]|nr:MFS transporter [Candidatus Cybelea sp.]
MIKFAFVILRTMSGHNPNRTAGIDEPLPLRFPEESVAVRNAARHHTALRLLPFLFALYVIAFLDRMNIGAAALEMPRDLGFNDRVVGLGAGIFFLGYFLLQIPGALIAERWSARRWITGIMVCWGILTVMMAFIHTQGQFYTVRFLIGAAEAGFFPAVIVYLTHWFQASDRAKAVAGFYAAMPLSYVFGSPIAGVLLGLAWLGLRGWRWLFIFEGLPAILMGLITVAYLTDWPREARWLSASERSWITTQLEKENKAKQKIRPYSMWQALRHRDVILLSLGYLFAVTGNYGIAFWLPSLLKRSFRESDLNVTLLAALPYLAGFVFQQWNGWHSDRTRERRWHAAIPVLLCGFALFLAVVARSSLTLSVTFFTMMGGAYYAYHPAFWAVPTEFLSESAAAVSIGLINSVGNLGGFAGPLILGYSASRTHSFTGGLLCLVVSFVVSGILMLAVRAGRRQSAPLPENGSPAPQS